MSVPTTQGSIRHRLLVLLLLSAALIGVLLYVVVQSVSRQIARESQDNILAASAISILDSARMIKGEVLVDLPYSALSMLDQVTDERAFYAIRLNGAFLSGYEILPTAATATGGQAAFLSAELLGDEIRVASVRRSFSTHAGLVSLEVSVAQTLTGLNRALSRISQISLAVGVGFFALSALMALLIARSTIRPLDRLTGSVSRRGPNDLRPVTAPVPSEMAPLVRSLNTLMERLQNSLGRSEEFIAEAAHRVRTPLAIVRTQAETTLRRVEKAENRAAVREMIRAIDESSRTAGQLLDHAMVTFRTDHLARETVYLDALAKETVERLHPISDMKDIEIRIAHLDPVQIRGDAILLQNALHNVLDNAIKYANRDSEIDVSVVAKPAAAEVRVSDTGQGFPDTALEDLTQRFARGANAEGVVGSGLGLTIVSEVVRAHGGKVVLSNTSGGGACVVLSFPIA
ncbi:MAG: sensor histidine kinase [Pseudomonadota bacterium]